jgi:hypothetical protein
VPIAATGKSASLAETMRLGLVRAIAEASETVAPPAPADAEVG